MLRRMKNKTVFMCNECGYESSKWLGKCPECGSWNTMSEYTPREEKKNGGAVGISSFSKPLSIGDVAIEHEERISTGSTELDRVLGGGAVKGSLVLVGGDPGIGKSTLLLQVCSSFAKTLDVLYVSGEESAKQIKMRAERLSVSGERLFLLPETNTARIKAALDDKKYDAVIIDSIQTMYSENITSAPGSVSQVREATLILMQLAKERGITIFIVGHVTKEGALAGPRVLEHMVDCVLYFEGDGQHSFRILRAVKNRFGSTNEIGVFEMKQKGLADVPNPSEMFLDGRPQGVPGSCVFCTIEGTRPILSEVQALVTKTGFGNPRRAAIGIDYNRVVLQIAVLEKRLGLNLSGSDIYINVAGGMKLDEPAADLAICMAIVSSFKNIAAPDKTVVFGEVGLTGEVRGVSWFEQRVKEAKKLGFEKCIMPKSNAAALSDKEGIVGAEDLYSAVSAYIKQ